MKKLISAIALASLVVIYYSIKSESQNKLQMNGPISSGYINVGNDKLYYETEGEGPVIILIHDGLVHSAIWDAQLEHYSKNHKVIRYDRRGYGHSTAATEEFSNVEDLNSLFSYFKVKNACLMAMSSGGRLAIDFTLENPQKVNSLVLIGAVVGGFGYTNHFFTRGNHLPNEFRSQDDRIMYYASDDPYEIYSGNIEAKEKIKKLLKDFPQKRHHVTSPKTSPDNSKPVVPSYKRLGEIKIPTLILTGEFDMPDVQAHAGVINAGISNSTRDIIPNAGHLIPIEQPELFNKRVDEFLNTLKY